MPEVLPRLDDADDPVSPPAPRSALFWDGYNWHVPRVDDYGRVQVRGEDQLFSFKDVLHGWLSGGISGADGWFLGSACPAGEIWVVTTVSARDMTTAPTGIELIKRHGISNVILADERKAWVAGESCCWSGFTYLVEDDFLQGSFLGGLAGDTCEISWSGYIMTLET